MSNELLHIIPFRPGQDGEIVYTPRAADGSVADLSAADLTVQVREYPGGALVAAATFADPPDLDVDGNITQAVADDELTSLAAGDYALTFLADIAGAKTIYPLEGNCLLRIQPA